MSSNSSISFKGICYDSESGTLISTSIIVTKTVLLIPLSIFVLRHGYQRWRLQHSFRAISHSDLFALHLAAMELFWLFGSFLCLFGLWTKLFAITNYGIFIIYFTFFGELLFHVLTCVEQYLAVIHPIIYRGLKDSRWLRRRHVCVGCVWLLCFLMNAVYQAASLDGGLYFGFVVVISFLLVISFCSISVLCALVRPGPGDRAGRKDRRDQSKQKACYTISLMSAAVVLWFLGFLLVSLSSHAIASDEVICLVAMNVGWLNVPSSLVSPLLYVRKAKKLDCCRAP